MPRWLACLVLLWMAMPWLAAAQMGGANPDADLPVDDADLEAQSVTDTEKEAAIYRLGATRHQHQSGEDAGAFYHLQHARQLLADDSAWFHLQRATRTCERGFHRYPYSHFAGDLLLCELECFDKRHRIDDMARTLLRIWYFLPDYSRIDQAMAMCLGAAQREQNFSRSVNLDADNPDDVIAIHGHGSMTDIDHLFRFLALHGDLEAIAPQAELGLARSQLLSRTKEDLFEARRSYEKLLEKYPNTDLTFNAQIEYALSHLVAYRGDSYDEGALTFASSIIDQAELETHGDQQKARLVQAYRRRIRLWEQDRDLSIARWYRSRGTVLVADLIMPPGLQSSNDGARYYYQAVVARDSQSKQGRAAARELSELPASGPPR